MKSDTEKRTFLRANKTFFSLSLIVILAACLASYKFWAVPNGLSEAEIASATISGHFSPLALIANFSENADWLINLPWTIVQWLSLKAFGVSIFGMRLPAVILMTLSALGLVLVVRKLSKPNSAIASCVLIVSSPLFIGLARSGTGASMTIFLIVLALYAASVVLFSSERNGGLKTLLAKVIAVVSLALLVYSPGGNYFVILFVIAGILHPKVRLMFVRAKTWKILVGSLLGVVALAPAILGLVFQISGHNWSIVNSLFALNGVWSVDNAQIFLRSVSGIEPGLISAVAMPTITLVGILIALVGLVRVCIDFFSARSYLILPMTLLAVALSIHDPSLLFLTFVPFALLIMVGIETIVDYWYVLFPRNPYARLLALIPMALLVVGVMWTSTSQYFSIISHNSEVAYSYNYEFMSVRSELRASDNKTVNVVASEKQIKFYETLQRDFPNAEISSTISKDADINIVLESSGAKIKDKPEKIITNSLSKSSVLLRIY